MEPDELQELITRCTRWPQAPRGVDAAQVARYAAAGLAGAEFVECRDGARLVAALARVELPWDSQKLGLKAARLAAMFPPDATTKGRELIAEACEAARSAGYGYAFTRVDGADIAAIQSFEANGFRLVDALITQYLAVQEAPDLGAVAGITIREGTLVDATLLTEIADRSFEMSRFHSDPCVGTAQARAIYREWIINGLNGLHDVTLVAIDDATGRVAGFMSCKEVLGTKNFWGWRQARIELVAVDAPFRGREVVRALARDLYTRAAAQGWDLLSVGTQLANIRALRAYGKVGFAPGDTVMTLRWLAKDS